MFLIRTKAHGCGSYQHAVQIYRATETTSHTDGGGTDTQKHAQRDREPHALTSCVHHIAQCLLNNEMSEILQINDILVSALAL